MFGKPKTVTKDMVLGVLKNVQDPELHRDLVTLNMVKDIEIDGGNVNFTITLTTPACPLRDQIGSDAQAAVASLPGVQQVNIKFDARVRADHRIEAKLNVPIKNIIAVASGKGGVGKTTVSANLAVALGQMGARVGILDADIYGPNVPIVMGVNDLHGVEDGKMIPARAHGIQVMSIGFLVPDGEALVWRGPMLHKAIQQLLTDVAWGDPQAANPADRQLDYLIVDLPPGTGDAQMSLAQLAPLTGAVIVTTPQAVALADATRGITAFNRLDVPIMGIIENMAGDVFGVGGGEEAARKLHVPFLGRVNLAPIVRESGDRGEPVAACCPDTEQAAAFRDLAQRVAAQVSMLNAKRAAELRAAAKAAAPA
ncbi:MAG: Septum site-determining protein MinD [Chloroflexi bacterium ADurb.Bin325]|nr:MAG: Septum site-determining protein MinD [Chloroflexi bacterium ADurb.Bin325]